MYGYKINKRRIKFMIFAYGSVILILFTRLYYLQIQPSIQVQGQLQNQQIETASEINYMILDRNGKSMLDYSKNHVLVIDLRPFKLNNYEENLEGLLALNFIMQSEDSDFNYSDIMHLMGKKYYNITEESYDKISELENIKGIYLYKYDKLVTKEAWEIENFIATTDYNDIKEGSFQDNIYNYIKDNKYPTVNFNLNQKADYIKVESNSDSENNNIKLTVDIELENKIKEVILDEKYEFLDNIGAVLLESDTGKVRAMVQKKESQANINLGIGSIGYEPGSIFKLIIEAIALDLGKISLDNEFICTGQICTRSGEPHSHGKLTVKEALDVSCNDIFADIGNLSGYDSIIEYTEKLGLYDKVLGIEGVNKEEAIGVKATEEDGISNISIGQCITVTPLQIAGAINAIVNDGIYVKPIIIDSIVNNNNDIIKEIEIDEEVVFSDVTAKIVQENMKSVIWDGSGFEAKVENVNQGGKTGTSTGEGGKTTHGWFAGYFEIDDAKYTLVILVPDINEEHPDGRELGGGNTAAPIFGDIIKKIMN